MLRASLKFQFASVCVRMCVSLKLSAMSVCVCVCVSRELQGDNTEILHHLRETFSRLAHSISLSCGKILKVL